MTLYNRTDLINLTTATVRHIVLVGLALVTLILIVFLGDMPISFIAALTIPCSLLFAFSMMVFSRQLRQSDFDRSDRFRNPRGCRGRLCSRTSTGGCKRLRAEAHPPIELIADATAEAVRPVAFSVLVIIVALIPLFTMQGVPGKIFAPMSETYGFALTGAFLFAILFAPGARFLDSPGKGEGTQHAAGRLASQSLRAGSAMDARAQENRPRDCGRPALAATLVLGGLFLGGEFMPKLEEGNCGCAPRFRRTPPLRPAREWRTRSAKYS